MEFTFDNQALSIIRFLYGNEVDVIQRQTKRYGEALNRFSELFGKRDREIQIYSTPGRTEIGGNHTDHNHGKVLAGGVNLDSIGIAGRRDDGVIKCYSKGYEKPFVVDLDHLEPKTSEEGSTNALIRGIAARLSELGYNIGGFDAYIDSEVLPGSGLSSSASIEVLLGTILNYLYNAGEVPEEELAKIGQYAENVFFGKPCGLMDQMACAIGGFVSIDFEDVDNPKIEKIDFDIKEQGYNLIVVDTGGNHSDLTDDYAAIPGEMKAVAGALGANVCRELSMEILIENIPILREKLGDRAILRAMHFFAENERVVAQAEALKREDFISFLRLVNESGSSSWRWLQNCFTTHSPREQGITLGLALTEQFMKDNNIEGACRVHGGGFAGTMQVFMPKDFTSQYKSSIENVFGKGTVNILNIRKHGTICVMKTFL
ncbi:MAG: galactokinase [Clostridiales bacterium]|nr:galactokinase [Clostridiales bacterium]